MKKNRKKRPPPTWRVAAAKKAREAYRTGLKVADAGSWTGRLIVSLVRLYKAETQGVEAPDQPLVERIEKGIEYLYRRGRDGRGYRRKVNEPTEPEGEWPAAAAGPSAEEDQ